MAEEQAARAEKSQGWKNREEKPKEWTVELSKVHRPSDVGTPNDVKRGDKADLVGRTSRGWTHPWGGKIPLKNRNE